MGLAKYLRILLLICLACPIFVMEVSFEFYFLFLQFKESAKNSRHSYLSAGILLRGSLVSGKGH